MRGRITLVPLLALTGLMAAALAVSCCATRQSASQGRTAAAILQSLGERNAALGHDDELRAWSDATAIVQDALEASNPGPYAVDAEAWKRQLSACVDFACARRTLHAWLEDLVFPEARPRISIPRSQAFTSHQGKAHDTLRVLSLADGWSLFILEGVAPARVRDGAPFTGGGVFVSRDQSGVFSYRTDEGAGYDILHRAGGWRVEQIGDCTCGAHITLSGDYR